MLDFDTLGVHLIREEKISDVHVPGAFHAGIASVLFHKDRAGIILVQNRLINMDTLSVEEMCGPDQLWHDIVSADDFGLSRAPGNQLLFVGRTIEGPFSQRHGSTSVTFHINVNRIGCIYPPPNLASAVRCQDQWHIDSAVQIFHDPSEFLVIIRIRLCQSMCHTRKTQQYEGRVKHAGSDKGAASQCARKCQRFPFRAGLGPPD
jgi:hypothetical protein